MSRYRESLPQLSDAPFLTDGGIETTLIFHNGLELPEFAAFDLLKDEAGTQALRDYFRSHAEVAAASKVGFILESATYRASNGWGAKIGYTPHGVDKANHQAIEMLQVIRDEFETPDAPMPISGCMGPAGDAYSLRETMTVENAQRYHIDQIRSLESAGVDFVSAFTMNHVEEAIGITKAAQSVGVPVVIAFTVETDGRLPSGQSLKSAIEEVDAATNNGPAYYMINCAHPTHYEPTIDTDEDWVKRIRGLRSNASSCSHAELDEAEELDPGNPEELGQQHLSLLLRHPHINIHGGCCGTDETHIRSIADACFGS